MSTARTEHLRTRDTESFREMQYTIVVKHYLDILPDRLVSEGNTIAVWNVASQRGCSCAYTSTFAEES